MSKKFFYVLTTGICFIAINIADTDTHSIRAEKLSCSQTAELCHTKKDCYAYIPVGDAAVENCLTTVRSDNFDEATMWKSACVDACAVAFKNQLCDGPCPLK